MDPASYDPNEIFSRARDRIKNSYGLELTLLELVELRNYVMPIINEYKNVKHESDFTRAIHVPELHEEVAGRFMQANYGFASALADKLLFDLLIFPQTRNATQDFFKRKQDEMHFP